VFAGLFPPLEKNGEPDYCRYYIPNIENGVCSTTSFSNTTVDCKGDIDYAFDK
jgi:hypothetical protein